MKLTFLIATCCAATAFVASAQNFAMQRFTIAGGGGTSAGAGYSLSGTIAQADASGPMSNGSHTMVGGFWSGATILQTPGAPRLHIAREQNGPVRLWWLATPGGFTLEETAALAPTTSSTQWSTVSAAYQTNAGIISATVSPSHGARVFRLSR